MIRRSPSSTAYERLGYAMFKQRRFDGALVNFKKAVALDPEDSAALNGIGVCLMTLYIQDGRENTVQRDKAIDAWRRSIQIRPSQPRIIDLLSRYDRL